MHTEGNIERLLSPYRVLDLTNEKGFLCGRVLAALGADVVKIEKPGGDPGRKIGPFYHDIPHPEKSLYWFAFNTGKRGITLDIETADGQDIFKRMVKSADIVIESFPPGYMDKLGLGYSVLRRINPRVIMTSITGFGQSGPYKDYNSPDLIVWALSGNLYPYGDPDRSPLAPSFPLAYRFAELQGAWSTLMALYQRGDTGKGQHIDAPAQLSLVIATGPEPHVVWELNQVILKRSGRYWMRAQTGVIIQVIYPCQDGQVAFFPFFGVFQSRSNAAFVEWMESEGAASHTLKQVNWREVDWQNVTQDFVDEISGDFAKFFTMHTKAELSEGGAKRDIQLYPVLTPKDIVGLPQLAARGYWVEVEHPELGTSIIYPGAFFKSTETAFEIGRRAPLIGEHNVEIYTGELGLTLEELGTLKQCMII